MGRESSFLVILLLIHCVTRRRLTIPLDASLGRDAATQTHAEDLRMQLEKPGKTGKFLCHVGSGRARRVFGLIPR